MLMKAACLCCSGRCVTCKLKVKAAGVRCFGWWHFWSPAGSWNIFLYLTKEIRLVRTFWQILVSEDLEKGKMRVGSTEFKFLMEIWFRRHYKNSIKFLFREEGEQDTKVNQWERLCWTGEHRGHSLIQTAVRPQLVPPTTLAQPTLTAIDYGKRYNETFTLAKSISVIGRGCYVKKGIKTNTTSNMENVEKTSFSCDWTLASSDPVALPLCLVTFFISRML